MLYGSPEQVKVEVPLVTHVVEQVEKPVEISDINKWIEENLEESITFYTEEMTKDKQISNAIISNSLKNDIPVNLAFSIAYKESKFKKDAYNDNGKSKDRGLFQLNDSYRQDWSIDDFYDIEKNSFEGTRYLKEMINLNEDDVEKALYCYNAGPTKVRRDGIIPESTKIYALEIMKMEAILNQQLKNWIIN